MTVEFCQNSMQVTHCDLRNWFGSFALNIFIKNDELVLYYRPMQIINCSKFFVLQTASPATSACEDGHLGELNARLTQQQITETKIVLLIFCFCSVPGGFYFLCIDKLLQYFIMDSLQSSLNVSIFCFMVFINFDVWQLESEYEHKYYSKTTNRASGKTSLQHEQCIMNWPQKNNASKAAESLLANKKRLSLFK